MPLPFLSSASLFNTTPRTPYSQKSVCCSNTIKSDCRAEFWEIACFDHASFQRVNVQGGERPVSRLIFIGHFPHKSPIMSGSFAERDLQLKASCAFSHSSYRLKVTAELTIEKSNNWTKRATVCRALLRKMRNRTTLPFLLPPSLLRKEICNLRHPLHFPQKSPIMSGSFAERDLQLKASYVFSHCSYQRLKVTVELTTGWRTCRGCLMFIRQFPQKSPIFIGSLAKRDLHKLVCTLRHRMHVRHPVLRNYMPLACC